MSLKRKSIPSPNYSSRNGAAVRLIVIHTAEGATTIESLGSYFANPASQVSSHVGIDDKAGTVGEYVKRGSKAWTAANANPYAVQAELCGFAAWSTAVWKNDHADMLENCARWIAEEAKAFGIPITRLNAQQAQGSGRGVCRHSDLGVMGGNHSDPGAGFPFDDVLDRARAIAGGASESEDYMDPPDWLWPWLRWYLTTDRNPADRPPGAPEKIPQWAWDYQAECEKIGKRFGMTVGERDWIDWRADGMPPDNRPPVPETIPPRWWDDNAYVDAIRKGSQ